MVKKKKKKIVRENNVPGRPVDEKETQVGPKHPDASLNVKSASRGLYRERKTFTMQSGGHRCILTVFSFVDLGT